MQPDNREAILTKLKIVPRKAWNGRSWKSADDLNGQSWPSSWRVTGIWRYLMTYCCCEGGDVMTVNLMSGMLNLHCWREIHCCYYVSMIVLTGSMPLHYSMTWPRCEPCDALDAVCWPVFRYVVAIGKLTIVRWPIHCMMPIFICGQWLSIVYQQSMASNGRSPVSVTVTLTISRADLIVWHGSIEALENRSSHRPVCVCVYLCGLPVILSQPRLTDWQWQLCVCDWLRN